MLKIRQKNNREGSCDLVSGEFKLLSDAFGRNGGTLDQRRLAQPIVGKYQGLGSGGWFYCNCRGNERPTPVLYPSNHTHVVRHPKRPNHDENCTFFCPPRIEWRITTSHRSRERPEGYALLADFSDVRETAPDRAIRRFSQNCSRPRLATLLYTILTRSGIMIVGSNGRRPSHASQLRDIFLASRQMQLDAEIQLSDYLRSGFSWQQTIEQRVTRGAGRWRVGTRPHGLLIDTIHGVVRGGLVKRNGDVLTVAGRVSVFGERDGDNRVAARGKDAIAAGKSYVAIVLFARLVPGGPVLPHSAYVHPCLAMDDLLLVDSDFERATMAQLTKVRSWVNLRNGISFTIEKPLFDIGTVQPEEGDLHEAGNDDNPVSAAPPPVLLPDFIIRRSGSTSAGSSTVIVETMGYADIAYRERKARIVPAMAEALGNAPDVKHDFWLPAHKSQEERDKTFRGNLRSALIGPWSV